MNLTHLHLLMNHIPVFGIFFTFVLLGAGMLLRNSTLKFTALIIAVVASLATLPVMTTGEEAEDAVEKITGVTEAAIHEHEESAEFASWMMYAAGAVAVSALLMRKRDKLFGMLTAALLVLSAVNFAVVARTGYLGGYIRHSQEFGQQTGVGQQPAGEHEDKD
jgi:hypothetical protein